MRILPSGPASSEPYESSPVAIALAAMSIARRKKMKSSA
jgi:hypothetical protein